MMMKRLIGFVGMIMVVFLVQNGEAHTDHVVGDSEGWTVPSSTDYYQTWASQNQFAVGDILIFNFTTNAHDVVKVPKASYDSCSSANNLTVITLTGPTNLTVDAAGDHYYICTIGNHCTRGQKLAITATATHSGSAPSPSSSSPPPPPPPPSSSASTVFASFFLVLLSIFVAIMF